MYYCQQQQVACQTQARGLQGAKNYRITDYDDENPSFSISLPYEILEEVLCTVWLSDISPLSRGQFISSVSLVSKLWLAIFTRILTMDVYIVSSSCLEYHRRLLRCRNPPETATLVADRCRSFTRQLSLSSSKRNRHLSYDSQSSLSSLRPGKQMCDMMATFRLLPYLQNLRSLFVEYYPTPIDLTPKYSFEFRVAQLDLEYTFAASTPVWVIEELGLSGRRGIARSSKQRHGPWALPDLEHVSTPDNDPTAVGDFLRRCPHLELAREEQSKIRVRVLSASRCVPPGCIIVHGALAPQLSCITLPRRSNGFPSMDYSRIADGVNGPAPRGLRGRALSIIIDTKSSSRRQASPVSNNGWRNVHVFAQRR